MAESSFLDPARAVRAAGIHEGHVVADLGAGSGALTARWRARWAPGPVWAVDINRDLLARALKTLPPPRVFTMLRWHTATWAPWAAMPPPPSEHFDFAILSNLLFSIEDKAAAAREVRRVLKKNGRALLIDWSGSHGGLGPHPDHVVTERAAKKVFEDEGFTAVSEIPAGTYHWGLVLRKRAAKN